MILNMKIKFCIQRVNKRYEKNCKVIVCYISLLRNGITLFEASEDCLYFHPWVT